MEQIIYIPRVIKMVVSIYKIQLGAYFLGLHWRLQTQKECHFINNTSLKCSLGLKTQCTTKSVKMAYYFDHLPNLKPLNLPFRQEIRIFYTKRLTRTWTML